MFLSILLVAVVASAVFWYKRWQKTDPKKRAGFAKQSGLWALIIVILALVVTGRAHWLMGVLAAILGLLGRVAQFAQYVPLFQKLFGAQAHAKTDPHQQASTLMSKQDAADLLGVDINASNEEIRSAHKRLMQKIHPDRGGSDALAKQINLAKESLLK